MVAKKWVPIKFDSGIVQTLQEGLDIQPLLCQLLVQRGIHTYEEAKKFFRPNLEMLHDPFLMKDMEAAVQRLDTAISKGERILLYGDYDVDGTTCVSLLYTFLLSIYDNIDYYIPDRYQEGYGVSEQGIHFAKANQCTLIIAMDCGIKAHTKVALAKELGIDFIICDHHKPDQTLPLAEAVLDPKRIDCCYPFKELSGCGVVFKFVQAFAKYKGIPFQEIVPLLDFVAVSICCDIVEMTDENRVLAYFGIWQLNKNPRLGFKALLQETRRPYPYGVNDIVFGLGPMINAAGRLGDAKKAVRLLLSTDKKVAQTAAQFLSNQNKKRRELDGAILREATEEISSMPDASSRDSFVLFNEHWHKGVLGIAASRIVELYHRPAIILTKSKGKAVGSARSIQGFNLYEQLLKCADLFENFGGHDHAAGLTLAIENIDAFRQRFEALAAELMTDDLRQAKIPISATIQLEEINPRFHRILKQFAPFGPKNRRPIFEVKNLRDTGRTRLLKNNHLKLEVQSTQGTIYKGIAFGLGQYFEYIQTKGLFHLSFVLEENHWKGKTNLELMVKDIHVPISEVSENREDQ